MALPEPSYPTTPRLEQLNTVEAQENDLEIDSMNMIKVIKEVLKKIP